MGRRRLKVRNRFSPYLVALGQGGGDSQGTGVFWQDPGRGSLGRPAGPERGRIGGGVTLLASFFTPLFFKDWVGGVGQKGWFQSCPLGSKSSTFATGDS